MKKPVIVVVEDEKDILDLIKLHLVREGHEVIGLESGETLVELLKQETVGLVVVDWMLPGISGLDLIKKIRSDNQLQSTPIMMVTARAHASEIVLGLEMGADDYVTKPFELPIFLARVRAVLRRTEIVLEKSEPEFLSIGSLRLNPTSYEVTCYEEKVSLTPSEFKLLKALMKNKGKVLTREKLIDLVQGEGVNVIDRTIDTHIFGLRKKLGQCSDIVETIRGVGYRVKLE